ncbi:MAG TPA: hypothetical protein VGR07_08225 [Thermoanaerobaculia bacterium]|jgi:hypothetical protein|nr:hypothetical protein [Thermoanaerobaculia bacterium]
MSRPDPDLDRSFAALRRQEREEGPPFRRVWAAAGRRRRSWKARPLRLATAGAAVVAAALLSAWLVALKVPAPPYAPGPSLGDWQSPTAFLLRTPGQELLREPPALGRGFTLETLR